MIYYIYERKFKELIDNIKALKVLPEDTKIVDIDTFLKDIPKDITHILVTSTLVKIKKLIPIAVERDITLGIIPSFEQKNLIKTFALPNNLEDAIKLALKPTEDKIDLLYCNNTLVLQEAVIGEAPPLDLFENSFNKNSLRDRFSLFWKTLNRVKKLKHTKMKITVANGNEIKLSAVGVVGIEYNNNTFASRLITAELSATDGKSTIAILSPQSILEYIGYLFKSIISYLTPSKLPESVGFIRSSLVKIETEKPLKIVIDSQNFDTTPVTLETKQTLLRLNVGENFWEQNSKEKNTKESIKIDHLPSDDERINYLSEGIPLFSHASQEQYASLFTSLREESKLNSTFLTLIILSTLIATLGLFINSSSVIIGAMLLAPLMQPIISLSMGVLRQDTSLINSGAKTITIGVLAVAFTASLTTLLTPIQHLTPEMTGRLSPTILDLFIAIVSGIAAAYVKSNDKIIGSLAGVAIAVALVPPIAVAGIGIGWGDWHMFYTAFLLFITNLVGIVLAAALTFMTLGFSPLHLAKKGVTIWLTIVAIVAIPLYSSFKQMKADISIQRNLSKLTFNLGSREVKLSNIKVLHHGKNEKIECEVISTAILSKSEKKRLKESILKSIHKQATIIVTFKYKL